MLLCDHQIELLIQNGLIQNYNKSSYTDLPISAGVSSTGYDLTLAEEMYLIGDTDLIDPLNFKRESLTLLPVEYHEHNGKTYPIAKMPPKSVVLAHSVETLNMPENVTGQCVGKSTYARSGVDQFGTPLEPGWCGQVTIELTNNTNAAVILYIGMGILQVQFFQHETPKLSYAKKQGKYQHQQGVTTAR